jgi:hypothetical protein
VRDAPPGTATVPGPSGVTTNPYLAWCEDTEDDEFIPTQRVEPDERAANSSRPTTPVLVDMKDMGDEYARHMRIKKLQAELLKLADNKAGPELTVQPEHRER